MAPIILSVLCAIITGVFGPNLGEKRKWISLVLLFVMCLSAYTYLIDEIVYVFKPQGKAPEVVFLSIIGIICVASAAFLAGLSIKNKARIHSPN